MMKKTLLAFATALCFSCQLPVAQATQTFDFGAYLANTPVPHALQQGIHQAQTSTPRNTPLDRLGRPKQEHLDRARWFAKTTPLPENFRNAILSAVVFFEGSGNTDIELPKGAPQFTQFYWPSVANNCIGGTHDALGTAIAVPGPAEIPTPGIPAHEAGFIFTALGTGTVAHSQMRVHWFNLDTLQGGVTPLTFTGINPQGPATVNAVAPTGAGKIVAVIDGQMATIEQKKAATTCSFIPTAVFFEVK